MTNKPATCEICGSTLRPTATYCAQCGTLVAAARFIRSLAYETVRSERGEDQDTGEPFRYIVVRAVWRGKPIRATKRYPTATSSPLGYLYPEHVGAILDALAAVALARYTATGWKLGTGPVPLADEPFITARERIGRHVDQETAKVTITGIELQLWHPIPPTSTQDELSDEPQERDERRGAAVARWVRRMRNGFPSEWPGST